MEDYLIRRNERDALMAIGLLSRAYQKYDPSIPAPKESAPTHGRGLNIFAAIIDNNDGEILGINDNSIHSEGNPLQHAEQRALREAISRVKTKRPKPMTMSWEAYYRLMMFMCAGKEDQAYVHGGATLYTTLEPCPMCSSSSLVSRMKRLVYLINDTKYGNAWPMIKDEFYSGDEAVYSELCLLTLA
jgi:tRNA(Arg) A34 adenosine deaminase TadA